MSQVKKWFGKNAVVVFLAAIVLSFGFANEIFFTSKNIINVISQMSINALIATGITYVIITGGIDIGVGSVAEARQLDALDLLGRFGKAQFELNGGNILQLAFTPNVDGVVFEERLGESVVDGTVADVEFLYGHTDEGGLDFPMPMEFYPAWLEQFGDNRAAVEEALGVKTQADLDAVNPGGFRGGLVTASAALAEARAATSSKPCFYYYFKRPLPGDDEGAAHSAELYYVFNCLNNNWRPYVGTDYEIANTMNAYWTNFAKTGDPNGEGLPEWKAYDPAAPARLHIEDGIAMEPVEQPAWQRLLIDIAK